MKRLGAAKLLVILGVLANGLSAAGAVHAASDNGDRPRVEYDIGKLPKPVARLREQIIDVARSGDVEGLRAIIDGNGQIPQFSFAEVDDPIAYWKEASGDGEGREILAIMIDVLEAGYVRVSGEGEQDIYIWPYFFRLPLNELTPGQEVELYRLITAQDRKDMDETGAYDFYRLGIAQNGQWQFFVAGD